MMSATEGTYCWPGVCVEYPADSHGAAFCGPTSHDLCGACLQPYPRYPARPLSKTSQRIRGGLLGDGISSFLSSLMTSMPNTTFSQNNGVIALTRCASRRAGIACACWLILFGILAKVCVLSAQLRALARAAS